MINLLKNYINNMSINDLVILLNKKDIYLNDDELAIIYKYLKDDWYTFIYNDPTPILNDLKNKLAMENYNKLYELYIMAKEKYRNYR